MIKINKKYIRTNIKLKKKKLSNDETYNRMEHNYMIQKYVKTTTKWRARDYKQ